MPFNRAKFLFSSPPLPLSNPPADLSGDFHMVTLSYPKTPSVCNDNTQPLQANAAGMLQATNPIRPMDRSFGENGKVVVVYGSGSCTISANGPWGCCLCRSGHQLASRLTVEGCIYLLPLGPMVRGIPWGWCAKPLFTPFFLSTAGHDLGLWDAIGPPPASPSEAAATRRDIISWLALSVDAGVRAGTDAWCGPSAQSRSHRTYR